MAQIYVLVDPNTGLPRYVGKTSIELGRRLREHLQPGQLKKNTHKNNWLKSLKHRPTIQCLQEIREDQIDDAERYWISELRRQGLELTNTTIGGEGLAKGTKLSEETRLKMSLAHLGKKCPKSPEHRAKLAAANLGKKASPETRAKQSLSHKGHRHRPEAIEKMRKPKRYSPSTNLKMAASRVRELQLKEKD